MAIARSENSLPSIREPVRNSEICVDNCIWRRNIVDAGPSFLSTEGIVPAQMFTIGMVLFCRAKKAPLTRLLFRLQAGLFPMSEMNQLRRLRGTMSHSRTRQLNLSSTMHHR